MFKWTFEVHTSSCFDHVLIIIGQPDWIIMALKE